MTQLVSGTIVADGVGDDGSTMIGVHLDGDPSDSMLSLPRPEGLGDAARVMVLLSKPAGTGPTRSSA